MRDMGKTENTSKTVRRMVSLDAKALRFALAAVTDDRFKTTNGLRLDGLTMDPQWAASYEAAETQLVQLIATAERG